MIAIVRQAEELVASRRRRSRLPGAATDEALATWWNQELRAQLLRRGFSSVRLLDSSPEVRRYVDDPRIAEISQRGPLTPDHVLRTKRLPLLIDADAAASRDGVALTRALDEYATAYRAYFARCAPGKDAAAYPVSTAAQAQLARICALEAGAHGVRVNLLHPHLVFDTALWTSEVLEARARAYGMPVEQYKTNNLLKAEITTADVARAVFALVGGFFDKTTGAQIAVDGGSDRTI